MAAPNIVNVITINGKTAVQNVTTVAANIVSNSAASGKVLKINSLIIANVDGTNASNITIDVYRASTAFRIASSITVPAGTSYTAITKDISIYLEEGDGLRCTASANSDLEAVCSYEEIS